MPDLFESAKDVLRWADEEIDKLKIASEAFFKEHPGVKFVEVDPKTGETVLGIRDFAQPTDEIRRRAYRAVNDLRSCLDQASFAAVLTVNGMSLADVAGDERLTKTNFPFGDTKKGFEAKLANPKGSYRDIPQALHGVFAKYEAYWFEDAVGRGNDTLRALLQIANPNKHSVPIATVPNWSTIQITKNIGLVIDPKLDLAKNEVEIGRVPKGALYDYQMNVRVALAFGDAGKLTHQRLIPWLRTMSGMCHKIMDDLEAEATKLARHNA